MELNKIIACAKEIREKYAQLEKKKYGQEWSRAEIMEGFIGDVNDLAEFVKAKEGIGGEEKIDEKLAHELADCFWSILILADKYGIDIEQAFFKNMDVLGKRIDKEMEFI